MIGSMEGNVLRIDYNIESASRGKFARIAVKVDLKKPLCARFLMDGRVQVVEYESLPKICFYCGCMAILVMNAIKGKVKEEMVKTFQNLTS
ncbi:hypothetical protein DITRI_Ditri08aG0045200 [Diplodiscus trichospermus]